MPKSKVLNTAKIKITNIYSQKLFLQTSEQILILTFNFNFKFVIS